MPLAACPRCNTVFNKDKEHPVCGQCVEAEEDDCEKVRAYLSQKPESTPEQVVGATGIDREVVMRLLDTGRIAQISSERAKQIRCGRCGAPAISMAKKLCEKCLADLNSELARTNAALKLKKKKEVRLGGSVRSVVEEKRHTDR